MKEFLMKEITIQSELYDDLSVSRTRTSDGFAQICIKCGKQIITFNDNDYEEQASELSKMLADITCNPCAL